MPVYPAFSDRDNHTRTLIDQLVLAADAVVRHRTTVYRDRFRLTEVQYRLLAHVFRESSVSLIELSQLVNRDCGQVSRAVKALVGAGLLTSTRRKNAVARSIELTTNGLTAYSEMTDVALAWEQAVKARLCSSHVAAASEAIRCLCEAAVELVGEDSSPTGTGVSTHSPCIERKRDG